MKHTSITAYLVLMAVIAMACCFLGCKTTQYADGRVTTELDTATMATVAALVVEYGPQVHDLIDGWINARQSGLEAEGSPADALLERWQSDPALRAELRSRLEEIWAVWQTQHGGGVTP